jgi:hypothetical protein
MRKAWLALMLTVLALGTGLTAQSKTGTVRGDVKDQERRFIPGVQITLTNTESKATYRVQTNESGEYKLDVPAGTYEISAVLPGFNSARVSDVAVKENESIRMSTLTLTLNVWGPVIPIPLGPTPQHKGRI